MSLKRHANVFLIHVPAKLSKTLLVKYNYKYKCQYLCFICIVLG